MKKKLILSIFIIALFLIILGVFTYKPITWTLTQYSDTSGSQAMCYTLTSNRGNLIVIDGGMEQNAEQLRNIIKDNGSTVDAWILTHPHPDHIGAFNKIYADTKGIKIKTIYDCDIDYTLYKSMSQERDQINVYEEYLKLTKNDNTIHHLQRNDKLTIDNLKINVYNSYDKISRDFSTDDLCNVSSLMFKVSTKNDSILFCGDCRTDIASDYFIKTYGKQLQADYIQMGHHGNSTLSDDFYKLVAPKVALFDAPDWLVTGAQFNTSQKIELMKGMGSTVYTFATTPNSFCLD